MSVVGRSRMDMCIELIIRMSEEDVGGSLHMPVTRGCAIKFSHMGNMGDMGICR